MNILIGGDTVGIRALAKSIDGYRSSVQTVHTTLDQAADHLIHDAGWHGDAAEAFREKWEIDAAAAAALDGVLEVFSSALDNLATGLEEAQGMLNSAVNVADADHLELDGDGNVLTQQVPADQVAALNEAKSTYLASVKAAEQHAQQARSDFAAALQVFLSGLGVGNSLTKTDGLGQSDYAALASLVRDYVFISGPLEDNLKARLAKTAKAGGKLARALSKMEDPSSKEGLNSFNKLLKKGDRWKDIQGAIANVHSFNEKLENLEEKTHTKILDQGIWSVAEDDIKQAGKFAKFMEDVPGKLSAGNRSVMAAGLM
ncbi:MAG: WXG100 family type VII secretion target [Streptomycetaceae bacterium]|nr:WXG100 family type VII secretion target [Streptomycetaceae bacterium]